MNELPSDADTDRGSGRGQLYHTVQYTNGGLVRGHTKYHSDWTERIYGGGGTYEKRGGERSYTGNQGNQAVRETPGEYSCTTAEYISAVDAQKMHILKYGGAHDSITRKEIEDLLGIGTTKACRLIRELCDSGELIQEGNGRKSRYRIK